MSVGAAALRRYRDDPDGAVQFVREIFKAEPDPDQLEALVKYQKTQRLCLKASKGTGKTTVLAWIGWHFLCTHIDAQMAAISISGDNLRDNLWKELSLWHAKSPFLQAAFKVDKKRIFSKDPAHENTWWISARSFQKTANLQEQANALAGLHADFMGFLIDEGGGIPRAVVATAEAVLATGKRSFIGLAGNPTNLDGPLYDACTTERHLWSLVSMTGDPDSPKRSPRVDIQWARDQIQKYGRESPWVKVNVFGEFPSASLNTLLGPNEVEAAQNRHYHKRDYDWAQKRLGIDVARFGDDLTVIFPRQGFVAFMPRQMSHPRESKPSVDIANRVLLAKQRWGSELEIFDSTGGWGAGAIDIMGAAGHTPISVQYNDPASDPKFKNKRMEDWWLMAEWIRTVGALPPIPELMGELVTPQYSYTPDGKLLLEPKDHIKERLGRSPNYADALSNTFAVPEMPKGMMVQQQKEANHEWNPYQEHYQSSQPAQTEFDPFAM